MYQNRIQFFYRRKHIMTHTDIWRAIDKFVKQYNKQGNKKHNNTSGQQTQP